MYGVREFAMVALILVVLGSIGTTVATAHPAAESPTSSGTLEEARIGGVANNSTVQHVNPASANEGGDQAQLREQLASRIASQLERSNIQLSRGQYEQADEIASEDLQNQLGQYVDVAGDVEETGDRETQGTTAETTETLQNVTRRQQQYVTTVRRYNRLYENYTQARERGNITAARQFGRQLERLAGNTTTLGQRLTRSFGDVTNRTGSDLTEANASLQNVTANITERQSRIRTETFWETNLSISPTVTNISFDRPFVATGRLTRANGSAVANRSVTLRIGSHRQLRQTSRAADRRLGWRYWTDSRQRVQTNETGHFSVRYRPVLFPTTEQTLQIVYNPRLAAPYLRSQANVSVTATDTVPSLTVSVNRSELQYRDRFTVTGTVSADNRSVPRLPVDVYIGDHRLGRDRTSQAGRFNLTRQLPAYVSAETSQITARVALPNRSIASADATTPVTVSDVETKLNVTLAQRDRQHVSGALVTTTGHPVVNQTVVIYAGEQAVGTLRTDAEGRYATTIEIPQSVRDSSDATEITVRFAANGTNFAPASASTTLVSGGNSSLLVLVAITLVVIAAVATGGWWFWRRRTPTAQPATEQADQTTETAESTSTTLDRSQQATELLEQARTALENEDSGTAIELAYAAVRERLGAQQALTHWEFYHSNRDDLSPDEQVELEELTQAYEQAVFAETPEPNASDQIIDAAETLVID